MAKQKTSLVGNVRERWNAQVIANSVESNVGIEDKGSTRHQWAAQ